MPFLKQKDPTVPPGQTVTDGFPVLHVGDVPAIDPKSSTRSSCRTTSCARCRPASTVATSIA
jgi:hypothetical protein